MQHTILFVDDDRFVLSGLRRGMRDLPYRILTESSPLRALELMKTEDVDLVVSDHDMGEMTGVEFLSRVHESWPTTIRFILTGKASLDMAIKAINEGAVQRFLSKPCNLNELQAALSSALQKRDMISDFRRLLSRAQQHEQSSGVPVELPGSLAAVTTDEDGTLLLDGDTDDMEAMIREMKDLCDSLELEEKAEQDKRKRA